MTAKASKNSKEPTKRGRPKLVRPLKRVNICVDPSVYEAIESLAAANGLSAALLVRFAMKEFVDRRRNGVRLAVTDASNPRVDAELGKAPS